MYFTYFVYNITLLIAVLSAFLINVDTTKNKTVKFILNSTTFFSLFITSAVRYQVGADYNTYVNLFENIDYFRDYLEIGYRVFIYLFRWLGFGSQSMFVLCAFLIALFVVLAGNKLNRLDLVVFMYVCYCYLNSLNAVRQEVATAIILYALACLYNKESFKYLILVFFATTFHTISLVMLPFIFLNKVKFNRYTILISLVILYFISTTSVVDLLKSSDLLGNTRYNFYLNSSIYNKTTVINIINEICRLFVLLPAFIIPKSYYKADDWSFRGFVLILNIGFITTYALSLQFYIFHRFVSLFTVALIFSFVLISKSNYSLRKSLLVITMIASMLYFENDIRVSQDGLPGKQVSPYQSILFIE